MTCCPDAATGLVRGMFRPKLRGHDRILGGADLAGSRPEVCSGGNQRFCFVISVMPVNRPERHESC